MRCRYCDKFVLFRMEKHLEECEIRKERIARIEKIILDNKKELESLLDIKRKK